MEQSDSTLVGQEDSKSSKEMKAFHVLLFWQSTGLELCKWQRAVLVELGFPEDLGSALEIPC